MLVDNLAVLDRIERHFAHLEALSGTLLRHVILKFNRELFLPNLRPIDLGAMHFMVVEPPLVLASNCLNAFRLGGHAWRSG